MRKQLFEKILNLSICKNVNYSTANGMQALEYDSKCKQLKHVCKEIPVIKDNHILVQVHYAGICGTDVHIIDGQYPCKAGPVILGHEFSGTVAEIGENVKHVKVNDKVVVDPNSSCMTCKQCCTGNPHYCPIGGARTSLGMFKDGGWAQYCLVRKEQAFKIPESLTLAQAALCEPMSCISHAYERVCPIPIGQRILILGAGIIGNLFTCLFHLLGHKCVTISEPNQHRLKLTEKLRTNYKLIQPDALCDSEKFDLIMDCSGDVEAMEQAFSLLNFGGKLGVFGVPEMESELNLRAFPIMSKELSIYGLLINPYSFPKALSYLESMGDRYLDYKKLGIATFSLDQYETAVQCLRERKIAKAMFKIKH